MRKNHLATNIHGYESTPMESPVHTQKTGIDWCLIPSKYQMVADFDLLWSHVMEISPEERPVPALAHCLASASGFCGFCAIWDAKTIMVYHYRCKIIFFSWYLYIIIMVKPSWYIIKARQQSSCLLLPFRHSPKRIEQLQTGKFMGKHHLYHSGTTCLFCLGAIWMFFLAWVSLTLAISFYIAPLGTGSFLPETISFCKSHHIT